MTTPLNVAEATDYRATSRHAPGARGLHGLQHHDLSDVLSFIAALAPRAHGLAVERIERAMTIAVEEFVIDATGRTASADIAAAAPPETRFFGHLERA